MPPVPVPAASRERLLRSAEDRWTSVAEIRPDLAPAVNLQRRLIAIVVDLTAAFETGRLPRLSLPPKYVSAKLARGVPALAAEPIPVPVPVLMRPLLELCTELAAGGAAQFYARSIKRVDGVSLLDFGTPEAMWHLTVSDFPAIVTMDAHGNSLHKDIETESGEHLAAIGG